MNNETHEDRVNILEGAPEDGAATHFDDDGDYSHYCKHQVMVYVNHSKKWIAFGSTSTSSRSLADIQKLVDMQNEIDALVSSGLKSMKISMKQDSEMAQLKQRLEEAEFKLNHPKVQAIFNE